MNGLRVTIRLSGAMQRPRRIMHLDGVLSAMRVQQAEDDGDPDPWSVQHDLPIERYEFGGEWVFKASAFRFERPREPHLIPMTARTSVVRVAEDIDRGVLAHRSEAMNRSGGPFKSSMFSTHAQWIDCAVAECVGDADGVRALLSRLKHFGGRRSIGLGAVLDVEVEECAAPAWHLRTLPAESADDPRMTGLLADHAPSTNALRAPYWRRTSERMALVPMGLL